MADHRIRHQKRFRRIRDIADFLHFAHQFLVDVQTARGIQDHHVVAFGATSVHGALGNRDGLFTEHRCQHRGFDLLAQLLQLLLGGRTVDVQRCQQNFFLITVF